MNTKELNIEVVYIYPSWRVLVNGKQFWHGQEYDCNQIKQQLLNGKIKLWQILLMSLWELRRNTTIICGVWYITTNIKHYTKNKKQKKEIKKWNLKLCISWKATTSPSFPNRLNGVPKLNLSSPLIPFNIYRFVCRYSNI